MNLPIAERELRIAARSPRTYRGRLVGSVIFGAITIWMFWFITRYGGNISMIAPQTFAFIAHMALLMCMFSVSITADALSSEKRNGTLGLLFLTDLKGRDIVFGKLASFGLISFFGLVGIIPILAMPVLMGGITGQAVFRTSLTLLNALFFALSIGLWVSSKSWEQKRAMNASIWIVVGLMWLLPGATALLRLRYPALGQYLEYVEILSPMYQQSHASPFGIGMRREMYWQGLAATHLLAWFALWRACAILPRAWQDRPVISAVGRWKKWWEELRYGSSEVRAALRARLLEFNAVHWLGSRERFAPLNSWLFVVAVFIGWIVLWAWIRLKVGPGGPPFWGLAIPATLILYLGLRIRTCAIAGEIIARDRFSGALELLLSTVLTEREVARGQWLTIRRTIVGPAIVTIFIGTFLFVAALVIDPPDRVSWAVYAYIGLVAVFISDIAASLWTGMWTACFSRTRQAAPGQAIMRLLLLPWLIFIGVTTFVNVFDLGHGLDFPEVFTFMLVLCIGNNLFWICRSRQMFYERLRIAASEHYQPLPQKKPWWRFWSSNAAVGEIRLSKAA